MTKRGDDEQERAAIAAATERLVAGNPKHSDGRLSLAGLWRESQVKNVDVIRKHDDLKRQFQEAVTVSGLEAEPPMLTELKDEIARLKSANQEKQHELKELRDTRHSGEQATFVAKMGMTTLERQLRDAKRGHASQMNALRRRAEEAELECERLRQRLAKLANVNPE